MKLELPSVNLPPGLQRLMDRWGQLAFNLGLGIFFLVVIGVETRKTWLEGRMNYVEVAFAVQNAIMIGLILIRREHVAVDRNLLHQAVAMLAFFSGVAFMGQPPSGGPGTQLASNVVTMVANVLGVFTLLNLGRSFGILIAVRKVKTTWLYSIVRHPMYLTDILLRVGFLISHVNWFTVSMFVVSTGAYVVRAILEERFLSRQPEYRAYMRRVRYRFVPFVF